MFRVSLGSRAQGWTKHLFDSGDRFARGARTLQKKGGFEEVHHAITVYGVQKGMLLLQLPTP